MAAGIVAGGGAALLHSEGWLDGLDVTGDYATGVGHRPAGAGRAGLLHRVQNDRIPGGGGRRPDQGRWGRDDGFDALAGRHGNMIEMGIIDPLRVVPPLGAAETARQWPACCSRPTPWSRRSRRRGAAARRWYDRVRVAGRGPCMQPSPDSSTPQSLGLGPSVGMSSRLIFVDWTRSRSGRPGNAGRRRPPGRWPASSTRPSGRSTGERRGVRAVLTFLGPRVHRRGGVRTTRATSPPTWRAARSSATRSALGWLLAANLMAMLIQSLSAKLGIATGRSLHELCREPAPVPRRWCCCGCRPRRSMMATDLADVVRGRRSACTLVFGLSMWVSGVLTGRGRRVHPSSALQVVGVPPPRGRRSPASWR